MKFKDYYEALDVAKTASAGEIKKAYRKLARQHHPDVSKAGDATERMAALNEANAVLSDPEKRAAYDSLGNDVRAQADQEFQPAPNWDEHFNFAASGNDGSPHSDFFEQLFGHAAQAGRARARGRTPSPTRGDDHHAEIELDLLDAYEGAERMLTLHNAGSPAQGRLREGASTLQVKIPKGVFEGQHVRLAGRGGAGSGGGESGDLLLELRFKPDARWHARGRDVFQRVLLSPWEAALGARTVLRTPGGEREVAFPAGWKAGRKLRLKGLGIPGKTPGDLYLELELALPAADSDSARAAYVALAAAFPAFDPRHTSKV